MCISRVGKILSTDGRNARIILLGDNKVIDEVDVSMIDAAIDSYVEVFANIALTKVDSREAERRKVAWLATINPKHRM